MPNLSGAVEFTKGLIKRRVSASVVLMACASLCVALFVLIPAPWFGKSISAELTIIVGGLTTIVSIVYVRNKKSEDSNNVTNGGKDNPGDTSN